MKKMILVLMAATLLAATTACGSSNTAPGSKPTANVPQSSSEVPAVPEATPEKTRLYGKVVSVVGNELELTLGTPKTDIVKEKNDAVDKALEEAEAEKPKDGVMAAVPMTPATAGDGGDFVTGGEVESNEPLVPITYTEEKKDITIPVGMAYVDFADKGRTSFEGIKEGNVLCIEMTGDQVSTIYFVS